MFLRLLGNESKKKNAVSQYKIKYRSWKIIQLEALWGVNYEISKDKIIFKAFVIWSESANICDSSKIKKKNQKNR